MRTAINTAIEVFWSILVMALAARLLKVDITLLILIYLAYNVAYMRKKTEED